MARYFKLEDGKFYTSHLLNKKLDEPIGNEKIRNSLFLSVMEASSALRILQLMLSNKPMKLFW